MFLDGEAAATTATTNPWITFGMFGLMAVIFYFLILRPQKKKQKDEQKLRDSIQVGDEVLTIGGVYGRIVSLKEDSFVLESAADHSKLRFARWAISQNLTIREDENVKNNAKK